MLKIGDFSKLSRITIRMLRHYDEIGILHPVDVDHMTGYRYYSEAQLPLAGRIQALKDLGFGLSVIREILDKYEDAREMERFLVIKKQEMEEEQQMLQQRIGAVRGDFYEKDEMLGNDFSWRTGEQAGGFDEKYREAGSALWRKIPYH